jgi:hypothetical protein
MIASMMGDAEEKERSRIEASKEEAETKHEESLEKEESSSEPAAKKKRTAERQMTKDDGTDGDGDDEEPADLNGPFAKASKEVLADRKIWKAKRPTQPAVTSTSSSSSNPFASTLLSAPNTKSSSTEGSSTKIFGASSSAFSGFGGFGSGSDSKTGGFGASSSSTGFGMTTNGPSTTSGFGAKTSVGGFEAKSSTTTETETKTTTSLFGNSSGTSGFSFGFAKPSTSASSEASNTAAMTLPENVELTTGEEDEMKMHEVRCKSFKWVVEEEKEEVDESPKAQETNPSVKPSSNFENKNQESEKSSDDKPSEEKKGPQHRWQELGIGPIKILRSCDHPDKFRLVQRRESTANGPAHKVILNVPLWKESTCKKTSEKHLSVTTVGASGEGETYALKFKEASQAASFIECATDVCAEAKSCFAEEN